MKTGTKEPAIGSRHIVASVTACLVLAATSASADVIVAENFGGTGAALNGTTADTFDAGITAAEGPAPGSPLPTSSTMVGSASPQRQAAYLNLGNYINNTKGTANRMFDLTMTISPTTGTWISLGFATNNTPNTAKDFTNTGSGGTTIGIGTIIYRRQTSHGWRARHVRRASDGDNAVDGPMAIPETGRSP